MVCKIHSWIRKTLGRDLPVGYYPVDANAARFERKRRRTFIRASLTIEQQVQVTLKEAGVGFLYRSNLRT